MADIRINALVNTASSTVADDYLAVDGSASGTRKLSAYSPTFGGNLTVSGTGTSSVAGRLDVTKSLNLGGAAESVNFLGLNRNVLGGIANSAIAAFNIFNNGSTLDVERYAATTGAYTGALRVGTSGIDVLSSSGGVVGSISYTGNLTVSGTGISVSTSAAYDLIRLRTTSTGGYAETTFADVSNNKVGAIGFGNSTTASPYANAIYINSSYSTVPIIFVPNGTERGRFVASTGNFLLGTSIDSGIGRLQFAYHTTNAGGIGFGSDVALFHRATGVGLTLSSVGSTTPYFTLDANGTNVLDIFALSSDVYFDQKVAGKSLFFRTNGSTTALTLTSTQAAQFAGSLAIKNTSDLQFAYPSDSSVATGRIGWWNGSGIGVTIGQPSANVLTLNTAGTTALTLTSTQAAQFAGTTDSSSSTTGALTVAGGVGIAKKLYVADWITSTGSSAALFFNSRTGANSNYAWYSPDGTVARLYDNTNAKTLVDFAANTGDASFAGTIATQGGTASTPANAFATGTAGTIRWDASYIYVCTAANTWKRAAIAAW